MDIVTFAVLALIFFISIIKYMEHKEEEALVQRWELVNYIHDLECNNDHLKETILSMFTNSMDRYLLPKLLFSTLIAIFSGEFKNHIKKFDDEVIPTKEEKEIFDAAFKKMIKVNFSYTPHWYVVFGIITLLILGVMEFFIRTGKTFDKLYNYQQRSYMNSIAR